jgi:hypothetical protein
MQAMPFRSKNALTLAAASGSGGFPCDGVPFAQGRFSAVGGWSSPVRVAGDPD